MDAIASHRQALYPSSTSWGIPTVTLNDLVNANAMSTRFRQPGSFDDLCWMRSSIFFETRDVLLPTGHPHQSTVESNLAFTLLSSNVIIISESDERLLH